MTDILLFLLILFIAYGIGNLLLKLFVKEQIGMPEDLIFSTGLGLALIGYSVYALGSAGLLGLKYIVLMLSIYALVAAGGFYNFISRIPVRHIFNSIKSLDAFEKLLFFTILSILVLSLFGSQAPETGNDALAYHLYHPKIFIQNHRIAHIPFTRESLWPYLTEMLFTLGLIFKSISIAKMFNLLFGILSAMAVFSFTERFFSRKEALLATALFYSAPGIFMQSVYAYVDLSLCFYSFASFYSILLWSQKKTGAWLILSGVFAGLALSVKLLGGLTLIALFVIILSIFISKREKPGWVFKNVSILIISASIVSGVWYLRSFLVLGNPVYPFLHNIFKSGWATDIGIDMGVRRDIVGFIKLPWDLVAHYESFGGEQIGVIFLAFLPMVLFASSKRAAVRYMLVFLLIHTIIWFWIDPNIRFAFVGFAIIFILIAVGFYKAKERYNLSMPKLLLCCCLLFNISLCAYYNIDAVKLQFGIMSKEKYLFDKERSYPVARFVNNNTPLDSVLIIAGEPRVFYFDRKLILYKMWQNTSSQDIIAHVKKLCEDKIAVYLICVDSTDYSRFSAMISGREPVYEIEREIKEGTTANYYIYKLSNDY